MTRDEFIICAKQLTPNLLRFSKRIAGNAMEAEDIVQECFEVLWKNLQKVEPGSAKSYLFAIAHNKIIDSFRADKKMQDFDSALFEIAAQTEETDTEEIVQLAINQIPALYKELIMLRDLENYSYKEIEEITQLTENQVKVYLFRARKAIKEKILQLEVL